MSEYTTDLKMVYAERRHLEDNLIPPRGEIRKKKGFHNTILMEDYKKYIYIYMKWFEISVFSPLQFDDRVDVIYFNSSSWLTEILLRLCSVLLLLNVFSARCQISPTVHTISLVRAQILLMRIWNLWAKLLGTFNISTSKSKRHVTIYTCWFAWFNNLCVDTFIINNMLTCFDEY